MRENKKEWEKLKASSTKNFINEEDVCRYSVCLGLYTAQNNKIYQKEQKQLTNTGTKWEEIKKRNKS